MIEYNEKEYHLKFNLERLKLVEGALKKPLITVYTEHGGAFSIDEMEKIFQLCLKERNADTFCGNGLAREIFKNCIELENGYATVNNLIATQLYEDCPFFVPKALLRFEYFKSEKAPEDAKPYLDDMDFAFFCVNFGYSKADYNELTPKEKAFIMKAYEDKTVRENTLLRDAVYNAVSNAFRKKEKSFKKLWKKASQPVDTELFYENIAIINEVEKSEGKAWVELLYREVNNGRFKG